MLRENFLLLIDAGRFRFVRSFCKYVQKTDFKIGVGVYVWNPFTCIHPPAYFLTAWACGIVYCVRIYVWVSTGYGLTANKLATFTFVQSASPCGRACGIVYRARSGVGDSVGLTKRLIFNGLILRMYALPFVRPSAWLSTTCVGGVVTSRPSAHGFSIMRMGGVGLSRARLGSANVKIQSEQILTFTL